MAPEPSQIADKFIVDRRRRHRNSDVARAVRRTRDRLSQQAGNPSFDGEMLKIHARAILNGALAIPLLVLGISGAGLFLGLEQEMLTWAVLSVVCYCGLYFFARNVDAAELPKIEPRTTRWQFLLGHFISGLGWVDFVKLGCDGCGLGQIAVGQAVILLVAIAATALIASSLRGAPLVAFALPVALYAWLQARPGQPIETMLAVLLIAALPFFTYVAGHLNKASQMLLSFRSEKDSLIAELETAKAMSDEARLRAEDANLAKSRFLATMSHELRTPLNAILGFSEVMGKEVLGPLENETYRDYARDIHQSGQHLLNLINEILDLSRIEAGRYQLVEEPLDLVSVVEECCNLMALKARAKDIRIVQQFEKGMPRLVADERSVRQVALNLLSNAVKFAPTGGEVRIRVGWTAGGGQYLAIKDNGPGIPANEIPVVLSAFGQGSIAIKSAEQGTGLGLPIVQGLVQLHGGVFDFKSKLREGTEAVAAFPASRVLEALPAMQEKHGALARTG